MMVIVTSTAGATQRLLTERHGRQPPERRKQQRHAYRRGSLAQSRPIARAKPHERRPLHWLVESPASEAKFK